MIIATTNSSGMYVFTEDSNGANVFMTKLSLPIFTYMVICPGTGIAIVLPHIGITRGLHWSTHETVHVKPLSCNTLELHGVHSGRPIKVPM